MSLRVAHGTIHGCMWPVRMPVCMNHPVVSSLIPVVLLIFVGFVAGKRQWIRPEAVRDLSNLVFLVLIQALLFRTMSTVHVERLDFKPVALYFVVAGVLFAALVVARGMTSRAAVATVAQTPPAPARSGALHGQVVRDLPAAAGSRGL